MIIYFDAIDYFADTFEAIFATAHDADDDAADAIPIDYWLRHFWFRRRRYFILDAIAFDFLLHFLRRQPSSITLLLSCQMIRPISLHSAAADAIADAALIIRW